MPADYDSTARGLSLPINDDREGPDANYNPVWLRFTPSSSSSSPGSTGNLRQRAEELRKKTLEGISNISGLLQHAGELYLSLSCSQKLVIATIGTTGIAALTILLIYRESIFAWIAPIAAEWRNFPFGWAILWTATFIVSFPPLIGYSNCVLISGFVFGFWKGWLIVASATVLGSISSFLVSRTLLSNFVHKLVAHDRRFTALALTLKHDGIKCLIMIRLCPLPYSLSNGAMSTFPTISALNFFIAATAATPKLLIYTFIGSRLAALSDDIGNMDLGTKIINYLSIALGIVFGFITAWSVYRQTKIRAQELETQDEDGVESFDDDADNDSDRGRGVGGGGGGGRGGGEEENQYDSLHNDHKLTPNSKSGALYADEPSWSESPVRPIGLRVTRPSIEAYQDGTVPDLIAYKLVGKQ